MIRSYLKIGIRNLLKHKGHSAINIIGLSVGMACFLLILFYIRDESSFDKFHKDYDQIYRVTQLNYNGAETTKMANSYSAIGPALANDFPEFQSFTRLHIDEVTVDNGPEMKFEEKGFAYADSSFWKVFDFKVLQGNPDEFLSEPFAMVLTQSAATKYFGNENPIGKTLRVEEAYNFKVTGLIEDIPSNSHIQFNFLASFVSLRQVEGGWMYNNWHWPPVYTYVKVPPTTSISSIEAKFPGMLEKYLGKRAGEQRGYELQPMSAIHTSTNYTHEPGKTTNVTYLYVLGITGFLILAIGCVNYMNLSLTRSMGRSTEVGIRKVFGAVRKQLIFQYLGESVVTTLISAMLGLGLFFLAIPGFNGLAQKELVIEWQHVPLLAAGILSLSLLVGFFSSLYPALFLSGFSPITILKGKMAKEGGVTRWMKKGLILFQFVISATLIISTLIIYFQLQFVRNKSLGFDKEQMLVVRVRDLSEQTRIKLLKDRLQQLPQVGGVTVSSRVPGWQNFYDYNVLPEGESVENNLVFMRLESDLDFDSVYGLEIVEGRGFDSNLSTDSAAYLINETAAELLGWDEPLNRRLNIGSLANDGSFRTLHKGTVIGVVKDFNFVSLHNEIDPVVMSVLSRRQPYMQSLLSVKLKPGDLMQNMRRLEEEWQTFAPNKAFEYFFIDDSVDQMYRAEKQLGDVFLTFSSISIFLACLGLFAMTALLAAQLRKEIGIRKVLGANVSSIVMIVSRSFMLLVVLAFVIACLIGYLVMDQWLENFAYKIGLQPWYFLLAGIMLAVIAFITVGFQSVKAARANPVEALRYE